MYIDLHCDTIIKYIKDEKVEEFMFGENSDINLKKLLDNKVKSQFMAIYLYNEDYEDNPGLGEISDWDYIDKCIGFLEKTSEKYREKLEIVRNYKQYIEAKNKNKLSIFITIEDGRCIRQIDDVGKLKNKGISLVTLLWNNENKIGYPHSKNKKEDSLGLTDFGIKIVEEMNKKGIIIDVSHLSNGGFWDVYKYSKYPFMATHSNAKGVQDHSRNLDDKQIKAIANKGGVIGLNVFPPFANGTNTAEFKDYKNHLQYILKIAGEDTIALGTDFDGINGNYSINSPKKVIEFMNYLNLKGFSMELIEKFAYKNVERFIQEFYWG